MELRIIKQALVVCFATAFAALAAPLAGCGPAEPIRLGFIGTLSGRAADLGTAGRDGFLLAVEQMNANGGVRGRRIETLVKDDADDPAQARKAAGELAAAGVAAIIGPMTSAMAGPVLETAAGTAVVSPTVSTSTLTGKDDLFLRVTADTRSHAELSARYHYAKNGVRRVLAFYDTNNLAYTRSWLTDFRNTFSGIGGDMVGEVPFASGENTDHGALLRQLLDLRPDTLLFVAGAHDTARFAQAARQLDRKLTLIGAEWAATEGLLELGGQAVDGVYLSQIFDREDRSPEYQRFRTGYEARFQRPPDFASIAAYDATKAVLDAMWRARPATPVKQALLENGPFAGVQQGINFDRYGDTTRKAFITIVRDGRYVIVE